MTGKLFGCPPVALGRLVEVGDLRGRVTVLGRSLAGRRRAWVELHRARRRHRLQLLQFGLRLVAEVTALAARGLRTGRTAGRALGYQQVLAQLDGGCTEAEARAETVRATRRFVRRQRSWFRRDPSVRWLDAARPDLVEAALEVVRR